MKTALSSFCAGSLPPSVNPFTRGENTSNMTKLFSGCQTESFLWPLLWLFSIWNLTHTHFFWPLCESLLQGTLFVERPTLCWKHYQTKRKFCFFYYSICMRFTTRLKERLSVIFIKFLFYPEFPVNCAMIGRYWIAWNNRCYFRSLPTLNQDTLLWVYAKI